MTQPEPITKFTVNLLRAQVPIDAQHPHGEAVIAEFIPSVGERVWLMLNPQEAVDLGRGLVAEGELARTGILMPSDWKA